MDCSSDGGSAGGLVSLGRPRRRVAADDGTHVRTRAAFRRYGTGLWEPWECSGGAYCMKSYVGRLLGATPAITRPYRGLDQACRNRGQPRLSAWPAHLGSCPFSSAMHLATPARGTRQTLRTRAQTCRFNPMQSFLVASPVRRSRLCSDVGKAYPAAMPTWI